MDKYENPFEQFRLRGTRDLGDDSVIDLKVIYNENDEYIALCVGQHGNFYTFGCTVKHPNEEIQDLNMPASCEYGLFEHPIIAYCYGLAYVIEHIKINNELGNMFSNDLMSSIILEVNRKKEELIEMSKAYNDIDKD